MKKLDKYKEQKFEKYILLLKSLYDLYDKLYDIEFAGKKDSDEYKKILLYIDLVLESIGKLLEKLKLTYEEVVYLLGKYANEISDTFDVSSINGVLKYDRDDLIKLRIINHLKLLINSNDNSSFSDSPIYLVLKLLNSEILIFEVTKKSPIYNDKLINDMKIHFLAIFLQYLQLEIDKLKIDKLEKDSSKSQEVYAQLLKAKYNFTFSNPMIEYDSLSHNMNTTDLFLLSSEVTGKGLGLDSIEYEKFTSAFVFDIVKKSIGMLLDSSLDDVSTILIKCCLKTSMVFFCDDSIKGWKELLYELKNKYPECSTRIDTIIMPIIEESLAEREKKMLIYKKQ